MEVPLILNSPPRIYPETGYKYSNLFSTNLEKASYVLQNCNLVNDLKRVQEIKASLRRLRFAAFLCGLFMVVEFIAGKISNSVAVYSDALHMLSDMSGFFINIFGLRLSLRDPSPFWTYGYKRVEIVGAIFSIFLIWIVSIYLCIEAAARLLNPPKVDGKIMIIIASCGIVTNAILAYILIRSGHGHSHFGLASTHSHGHQHNGRSSLNSHDSVHSQRSNHSTRNLLKDSSPYSDVHSERFRCDSDEKSHIVNNVDGRSNVHSLKDGQGELVSKIDESNLLSHDSVPVSDAENDPQTDVSQNITIQSAYAHMLGDMFQNVGVLIAGLMIMINSKLFMITDPICTLIFAVNVFAVSIPVAWRAFYVLMDTVPSHIDTTELLTSIRSIENVEAVNDFHVWNVGFQGTALTVKLDVSGDESGCNCFNRSKVTSEVRDLADRNAIVHVNIEVGVCCSVVNIKEKT